MEFSDYKYSMYISVLIVTYPLVLFFGNLVEEEGCFTCQIWNLSFIPIVIGISAFYFYSKYKVFMKND